LGVGMACGIARWEEELLKVGSGVAAGPRCAIWRLGMVLVYRAPGIGSRFVLADDGLMSTFLCVLGHGGFGLGTSRYRGRV